MADAKKFRFVSPGIFLNEIDQSYLSAQPTIAGPVIIGRAEKGPGMIPVRVGTWSEFVNIFGNPIAGNGASDDVWRNGNFSSPTYGAYAAQAYLRAGVGPVTFVRLVGVQNTDATSAGNAGWVTTKDPNKNRPSNGGPMGLFVWPSGTSGTTKTGALAAIWYVNSGSMVVLSGNLGDNATPAEGAGVAILSDTNGQFKARIVGSETGTATYGVVDSSLSATQQEIVTFSLNQDSDNFIRKMFNTNPIKVNVDSDVSESSTKSYWLGETYERHLATSSLNSSKMYGVIASVTSGSGLGQHDKRFSYRDSMSGWFFSQLANADTSSYEYDNMTKLFRFAGINGHGEWLQNNVKISIANIKAPSNENIKYGTFDVLLRKANDSDQAPMIIEQYSNCNLDPSSFSYIGNQIGDTYRTWDDDEDRYRTFGNYPNRSKYVRVILEDDVAMGAADPSLLPFGVYGPPRLKGFTFASGTLANSFTPGTPFMQTTGTIPDMFRVHQVNELVTCGIDAATTTVYPTCSMVYPAVGIRSTDKQDNAVATKNAFYGLHTGKSAGSSVHDESYPDYLRSLGEDIQSTWTDTEYSTGYGTNMEAQWVFTLDEISCSVGSSFTGTNPSNLILSASWVSGSVKDGSSWNVAPADTGGNLSNNRYQNILDSKINRFSSPLFGGFDGVDIKERNPFRNSLLDDDTNEISNYAYNTVKRAINTVADPEVVECNAICMPGLTEPTLTKYLIDVCQERADALGIIDIEKGFQPREESNSAISSRKGDLPQALTTFKARNLNNSYGCAYYPWVTIRDNTNSTFVKVPPSVVALGTMANTERTADVWFAPAGFQRGGLSQGAAGLVVTGVETRLTSQNRDDLYDMNINPIASFPREGIVVFGQKTLQANRSALDRINVRRLLLYVKKGISQIASTTLFQPNIKQTWDGFKVRANDFLGDVKIRFGVDDYRVILDGTTTTPDLIDQNIMYAKIYIKPTRAIEFIAIDFIITKSGASFND
jgi:hypothetical protein